MMMIIPTTEIRRIFFSCLGYSSASDGLFKTSFIYAYTVHIDVILNAV